MLEKKYTITLIKYQRQLLIEAEELLIEAGKRFHHRDEIYQRILRFLIKLED